MEQPIRVHFTYRHVDRPWGGANNFIRALHHNLSDGGAFQTVERASDCDILFMNQLGGGPGGDISRWPLRWVKRQLRAAPHRRLVVRAINLNGHAFRSGIRNLLVGRWRDRQTIALLNMADLVIFQSEYQRGVFEAAGFCGKSFAVVHNGADPAFWIDSPVSPPSDGALRLVSSTASPRQSKRHDLIAELSCIDGVEVRHLGAWPDQLDPGRVKLLGLQDRAGILEVLRDSHYFVHLAERDPCPNAVFEAVCAGLPVLYNPAPGSSAEIVGGCGLAIDVADMQSSIAVARSQLTTLRRVVLRERHHYLVDYAASQYRRLFEAITRANR